MHDDYLHAWLILNQILDCYFCILSKTQLKNMQFQLIFDELFLKKYCLNYKNDRFSVFCNHKALKFCSLLLLLYQAI
mgnify:CR=1 FL=1